MKAMSLLFSGALVLVSFSTFAAGDAKAGKGLYSTCIACHGPSGEGNMKLNAPLLAGQGDWYIARQLKSFKDGIRGSDPKKDAFGAQMRPMAMMLKDDKAINDVSAYIATFPSTKAK